MAAQGGDPEAASSSADGAAAASPAPASAAAKRAAACAVALPYLLLLTAATSASTGTTWFALQEGTPVWKAAWRMQLTVLMQLPLLAWEVRRMEPALYARWRAATLALTLPTGVVLGTHFALVAASVQSTSLAHAILACNCPPLFLIAAAISRYLLGRAVWGASAADFGKLAEEPAAVGGVKGAAVEGEDAWGQGGAGSSAASATVTVTPAASPAAGPRSLSALLAWGRAYVHPARALPPTRIEVSGALLSFRGITLLVAGSSSPAGGVERGVTAGGDLLGVAASAMLALYFTVGGRLRKWMPLFSWLCPLHASAALFTTLLALAVEPGTAATYGALAWGSDARVLGYAAGAAVFAGMIGHGLANYVMATLSPLIVSVAMLGQPLIGSLIGYGLGVQGTPSAMTLVAAPLILAGAYATTVGTRERGLSLRDVLTCRVRGRAAAAAAAAAGGGGGK
jgi:drug/metabolite transporter (DMT)-like permease